MNKIEKYLLIGIIQPFIVVPISLVFDLGLSDYSIGLMSIIGGSYLIYKIIKA